MFFCFVWLLRNFERGKYIYFCKIKCDLFFFNIIFRKFFWGFKSKHLYMYLSSEIIGFLKIKQLET